MLVQFSVKNFKCFKEEAKMSLIASNYDQSTRNEDNVFLIEKFGLRLLKSSVIYGANASGKSKLFEGLAFMKHFILESSKEGQIDEKIRVTPFLLNSETEHEPTFFEIIFIHEEEMFRYGFELDQNIVHAEWLYHRPKTKETELFYRDFQNFELNSRKFKVADLVKNDRIRPNALLLSVAANWNDKISKKVFDWLKTFNIISGLKEDRYEGYSMSRIKENKKNRSKAIEFLRIADLGIEDLQISSLNFDDLPKEFPDELIEFLKDRKKENEEVEFFSDVKTFHKKYDANLLVEDLVEFSMEDDESSGTKKYFALSGPILETLKRGEILVVDELANKLHTKLVNSLIELFNSQEKNPLNAQLIFNTHDTNLLSSRLFRRDQIWFMEKDRFGATSLYSLGDFKTSEVRKEDNFEKKYLEGKYGAIPYLNDFHSFNVN